MKQLSQSDLGGTVQLGKLESDPDLSSLRGYLPFEELLGELRAEEQAEN